MSDCISSSDWCGAHSSRPDNSSALSGRRLLPITSSTHDGPLESTPKAASAFRSGKSRLCGCSGMRTSDTASVEDGEDMTYSPGVLVDDFSISNARDFSLAPLHFNDTEMSSRLDLTSTVQNEENTDVVVSDGNNRRNVVAFTARQNERESPPPLSPPPCDDTQTERTFSTHTGSTLDPDVNFIDFYFQQNELGAGGSNLRRTEPATSSTDPEATIQNYTTPVGRQRPPPAVQIVSPNIPVARRARVIASETFDYPRRDDTTVARDDVSVDSSYADIDEWERGRRVPAPPRTYVPTVPANSPDGETYDDSSVRYADSSDYADDQPTGTWRSSNHHHDQDTSGSSDPVTQRADRTFDRRSSKPKKGVVIKPRPSLRHGSLVKNKNSARICAHNSRNPRGEFVQWRSPRGAVAERVQWRSPVMVTRREVVNRGASARRDGGMNELNNSSYSDSSSVDNEPSPDANNSDLLISPNGGHHHHHHHHPDVVLHDRRLPTQRSASSRRHQSSCNRTIRINDRHRYSGSAADNYTGDAISSGSNDDTLIRRLGVRPDCVGKERSPLHDAFVRNSGACNIPNDNIPAGNARGSARGTENIHAVHDTRRGPATRGSQRVVYSTDDALATATVTKNRPTTRRVMIAEEEALTPKANQSDETDQSGPAVDLSNHKVQCWLRGVSADEHNRAVQRAACGSERHEEDNRDNRRQSSQNIQHNVQHTRHVVVHTDEHGEITSDRLVYHNLTITSLVAAPTAVLNQGAPRRTSNNPLEPIDENQSVDYELTRLSSLPIQDSMPTAENNSVNQYPAMRYHRRCSCGRRKVWRTVQRNIVAAAVEPNRDGNNRRATAPHRASLQRDDVWSREPVRRRNEPGTFRGFESDLGEESDRSYDVDKDTTIVCASEVSVQRNSAPSCASDRNTQRNSASSATSEMNTQRYHAELSAQNNRATAVNTQRNSTSNRRRITHSGDGLGGSSRMSPPVGVRVRGSARRITQYHSTTVDDYSHAAVHESVLGNTLDSRRRATTTRQSRYDNEYVTTRSHPRTHRTTRRECLMNEARGERSPSGSPQYPDMTVGSEASAFMQHSLAPLPITRRASSRSPRVGGGRHTILTQRLRNIGRYIHSRRSYHRAHVRGSVVITTLALI